MGIDDRWVGKRVIFLPASCKLSEVVCRQK